MDHTRLSTSWHDETLTLLVHRPRTLTIEKISQETGLTNRWLDTFLERREGHDPGVSKVETLNKFLKKYAAEIIGNVQFNS